MRLASRLCLCLAAVVSADVLLLQDTSSSIVYTGSWNLLNTGPGLPPYNGGSVHWTNVAGSTVGVLKMPQGACALA